MSNRREFVKQLSVGLSATSVLPIINAMGACAPALADNHLLAKSLLTAQGIGQPTQVWLTDIYPFQPGQDIASLLQNRLQLGLQAVNALLGGPVPTLPVMAEPVMGSQSVTFQMAGVTVHWQGQALHGSQLIGPGQRLQIFGDRGTLTLTDNFKVLSCIDYQGKSLVETGPAESVKHTSV
ncbi:hypothetical protein [Rudanella lutea]|uniref:hypothetical protein n=1 Tax=Rudanella lutea TaxID=451374 RepID=UPI000361C2EB|nr:hypothetical protein [Rudanella lutea]